MTMGGPRDKWPLGRGFERFYGFLGGETDQYHPDLVYDNHPVSPPRTPEEGYHLTEDLADHGDPVPEGPARDLRPTSRSSCTSRPGRATRRTRRRPTYIDRYRGRFDQGWDRWRDAVFARQLESGLLPAGTELSERPSWVPAWESLVDGRAAAVTPA